MVALMPLEKIPFTIVRLETGLMFVSNQQTTLSLLERCQKIVSAVRHRFDLLRHEIYFSLDDAIYRGIFCNHSGALLKIEYKGQR